MDALFKPLADSLGASVDQIKLIACLLFSYPLANVFAKVPASQPTLKHLLNVSITLFYLIPVLNIPGALLQLLVDVFVTYFLAASVKGPQMPWLVFGFNMTHLYCNHVIRAIYNLSYETIEVTGPQMILVMKLTTFAWNVWDGRRPVEELDKWQLEHRVTKYPSVLEFLGYSFYFPGVLVGPYLEYAAYMSLINETLFTAAEGQSKGEMQKRRLPSGRNRTAYKKGLLGLVFLGTYVALAPKYSFAVSLTNWFATKSVWYRIAFMQICGPVERVKYYALWTITEGASILTGLGFTGYDKAGKPTWEGAKNVDIWNIELASSFKVLLDSWNMKTNVWLRECTYKRVTPKGKKPGFRSTMLTFVVSALWHGCSMGYYLCFLFGGFVQTLGRLCRTNFRPLFLEAVPSAPVPVANGGAAKKARAPEPAPTAYKWIYDWAGIAVSLLLVNYAAMAFMIAGLHDSLETWRRVGWYGIWIIVVGMSFFYGGGAAYLKGVQAGRLKRAGVAPGQVKMNGTSVVAPVDSFARAVEKRTQ